MEQNNYNGYDPQTYTGADLDRADRIQSVMSRTFLFMFGALLLSVASVYVTLNTSLLDMILSSRNSLFILLIAELVVVMAANSTLRKNLVGPSALLFAAYSIINGMTLSVVFLVYDLGSVFSIFLMAAVIFGVMAIFGLVTKKDLSSLGTIGMMGLIGIIVMGIANVFFIKSDSLGLGIAAVGLAVFIGLTAYDTKKIKDMAAYESESSVTTLAMFGALILYLDFINIFLKLLRLFGKKN